MKTILSRNQKGRCYEEGGAYGGVDSLFPQQLRFSAEELEESASTGRVETALGTRAS